MNEKKEKRLVKNIGILSVGNFSSKLLSFLLVPLYTNVLSTAEYGIYDLSFSLIQILFPILTCNIVDGIMVFAMTEREKSVGFFRLGLKYVFGSWAAVAGLFYVSTYILGLFPSLKKYAFYVIVYYGFYALNQLLLQYIKALEKTKDIAISGMIASVTMLAGNLFFLLVAKLGLGGFYLANIIGQVAGVIVYAISIRGPVSNGHGGSAQIKSLTKDDRKELIGYSIPLIAVSLSWWVNNALDKYVVAFMCGVAATGLLSIAYKIPSMINIVQQIFIQAWHISGIEEYGKEESSKFYDGIFRLLNGLMSIVCSFLIISAKYVAKFLFSNDFYVAWMYSPFLIVSCVISAAAGFFGPVLAARKDSVSMAKSGIYGAVSNGLLNLILVYAVGIQGATVATLISSAVIYFARRLRAGSIIRKATYRRIYLSWGILVIQAILLLCGFSILVLGALMAVEILLYRSEVSAMWKRSIKVLLNVIDSSGGNDAEYGKDNNKGSEGDMGGVVRRD